MSREHVCPDDHAHAQTSTCYLNHRCGCSNCLEARTQYQFWRRRMRAAGRDHLFDDIVDARGVRRRLQALIAMGYSARRLGARIGGTDDLILGWLDAERVRRSTHVRVAALYEQLHDQQPPTDTQGDRASVHRARNFGARRGYAPPQFWFDIDDDPDPDEVDDEPIVDVIAIELAMDGRRSTTLTQQERRVAVEDLNARRYSDGQIAALLGVNERTILRDREALNLPAAVGHDNMPLPRKAA